MLTQARNLPAPSRTTRSVESTQDVLIPLRALEEFTKPKRENTHTDVGETMRLLQATRYHVCTTLEPLGSIAEGGLGHHVGKHASNRMGRSPNITRVRRFKQGNSTHATPRHRTYYLGEKTQKTYIRRTAVD
ncbi:hypothetical protein PISMIDRAFT_676963 [Pisolithus microcarpus 441]|uniref:Uncharacterized protein n=1 Tax=Pisolithus microcarpus 441 TaxID=765257 RepID=A0A0D0A0P8_9AGAM|nr:hypothetical protein PISMIDRAFT_676963 [Pisolithus microcarpus 441]